jgi:penicillin-binding protein 1C
MKIRRFLRTVAIAAAIFGCLIFVAWLLLPRPELFPAGAQFSREVLDRDGKLLHLTLTPDGKYRLPAKVEAISPDLIAATLAMEDRRFYSHPGTDPCSLARAIWGAVSGQRLGGGSTISMQYARLRWGLKTRSWSGKAVQIARAIQLERHYPKRDILAAYFTFAPYGSNVEGASAASLLWCGKQARDLSLRESVALAVLPQSPTIRCPRPGNTSAAAAQARLMTQLRGARGQAPDPLAAEFSLRPFRPARLAPHLSRELISRHPDALVVRSTLNLAQQQTIERSMADFLDRWHSHGLRNAAAILVHAPTREVRAWVGSADFLNARISGQVDGVTARRSPGSALKPFIYALGFDQGLIHPRTLLDDAPRRFAGYNPENSDRGFLGPIPAGEALRRSRNLPAVELAARLRAPGLDGFLRHAGVQLTRPSEDYGLSLALGGAEVTLEELAMLYSLLATDGVARPLRVEAGSAPLNHSAPLLSPAARWLTIDALRGEPGVAAPSGLAWKTGTSHGFRDAWACGVIGDWVLCVWVGHFDGTPMPGLFARDTAAPLLFQTAARLGLNSSRSQPPAGVTEVSLCADSGMLTGPHCPHRTHGWFIAGVSPIGVCDVHREATLADGRREVREFWPAQRLEQFRRAGLPRAAAPTATNNTGPAPRIVSPQSTLTYVLRRGDTAKNSIPLEADAAPGVRQVHWFAGSRYLGASAPAQAFPWHPEPGRWTLQALDDFGRTTRVAVTVSME